MRLIIVLVCFAVFAQCKKERLQDGGSEADINKLTEKLWLEIQKRLQDYDDKSDSLDSADSGEQAQCRFGSKDGMIIRTKDSLDAGATFLSSPTVSSRSDCEEQCCSIDNCNLAVFKAKDDHACYLFDCGTPNICEFTSHPGFEVLSLPTRKSENKEQAKHEDALEHLAASPEPDTTPSPPSSTPSPEEIAHEPSPLFGECKSHKDCAGTWTNCIGGYCLCQDGYHAQDGVCRKDCSRFEFECANDGQPLIYPQCIAIYDKCDGIIHCKDNSDELNCDSSAPKDTVAGDKSAVSVQVPLNAQGSPPVVPQQPQSPNKPINPAPQQVIQQASLPAVGQSVPVQQPLNQQQSYWQQLYDQQFFPQAAAPVQPQAHQPVLPQQLPAAPQSAFGNTQQYLGQPVQVQPEQQVVPQPQYPPQPPVHGQVQQNLAPQQPQQAVRPVQPARPLPAQKPVDNGSHRQQNIGQPGQGTLSEQRVNNQNQGIPHTVGRKQGPRKPFKPAYDAQPLHARKHPANNKGDPHGPQQPVGANKGNSANGGQVHHSDAMISHKDPNTGDSGWGNVGLAKQPPASGAQTPQRKLPAQTGPRRPQKVDSGPPAGPGRQSSPVQQVPPDASDSRPDQGDHDFPYPDAQNYYNYFRGNFDNPGSSSNYYGTNSQGGLFSDGGSVEGPKNNYGGYNTYGNRDKGYLGGYSSRLWQQATGDKGNNYNPDYDSFNYDSSDTTFNGGGNDVGSYDKNGDYTDYYSSPVDSDQWPGDEKNSASNNSRQNILKPQRPVNRPPAPSNPMLSEKVGKSSTNVEKNNLQGDGEKHNPSKNPSVPISAGEDTKENSSEQHGNEESSRSEDSDTKAYAGIADNKSTTGDDVSSSSSEDGQSDGVEHPLVEVAPHTGELDNMVDEEDDDVVLPSNKGAIVALALGLAITALLLVFVGCRLRNVKRRLRRGRPLNSNEADYLVNGMYL